MRGLVLEGGGVKGSYQIGAFYAFKKCHIKLDGFVGSSIGSFNAAMLAANKHKELLDFWYKVKPSEMLGFKDEFVNPRTIGEIINSFVTFAGLVKNLGIDNETLLDSIKDVVSYNDLIKSKKDFGLVTVRVSKSGFKPIYVYKDDISSQENLIEYIMASSYLLVFKEKRMIDGHYYIDGGFYDVAPIKLLADKGYEEVYNIGVKGIGIHRKEPGGIKVTNITPSRKNGKILEFNQDVIRDNIMMGYYDTLRVLKHYDGNRYCFKRRKNKYYKFLSRKIDKRLFSRVENFFGTTTYKKTVLAALEYALEKDYVDYYDVYNPYKLLKKYRNNKNKHFVYRFLSDISFF